MKVLGKMIGAYLALCGSISNDEEIPKCVGENGRCSVAVTSASPKAVVMAVKLC